MKRTNARSLGAYLLIRGLVALQMMLVFAFRPFEMPSSGLDISWAMVLVEASKKGWQWGRDVIFTFGPYGYLYWNIFDDHLFIRTLVFNLIIGTVATAAVLVLLHDLSPIVTLCLSAAIIVGANVGIRLDPFYMTVAFLAFCGHYRQPRPVLRMVLIATTVTVGLIALIKLSFAVAALGVFLFLDLDRLTRRLWVMYVPLFLASSLAFYLAAGQSIAALPHYLDVSKEVISGYTGAMSTTGSLKELVAFCAVSSATLALIVWNEGILRRGLAGPRRPWIVPITVLLAVHLTFKAGFVRPDGHAVVAWGCLTIMMSAYMASTWANIRRNKSLRTAFCVLLLFVVAMSAKSRSKDFQERIGTNFIATFSTVPAQHLRFGMDLIYPSAMRKDLIERREAALSQIRKEHPLPKVTNTVDVVPSMQSAVIAHGYSYRPRPSFQDYSTYSDGLIDANIQYLSGSNAPDTILFGFFPIDGRIPSLSDGALWPELLRDYDIGERHETLVLLHRRAVRRSNLLGEVIEKDWHFDKELPIPVDRGAEFVEIDIHPNLFGKVADVGFKEPPIYVTFTLSNGTTEKYRIIPNLARRGFVVSPLVDNAADFSAFAQGSLRPSESARRVVSLRIDLDNLSRWLYSPTYRARFKSIDTNLLRP